VVATLTSFSSLLAATSSGETNGFDLVSLPFWLGAGLALTGAIFRLTRVRGTIVLMQLVLVVTASYILFSNDLI
jgi:hypothetical protein